MATLIQIELRGPDFIKSAVEIAPKIAVNSIAKLFVFNMTVDCINSLQGALLKLKTYFATTGVVIITTSQILPSTTKTLLQTAAGVPVQINQSMFSIPLSGLSSPLTSSSTMGMPTITNTQQMTNWTILSNIQTTLHNIQKDVIRNLSTG
jgi:hypothetical protein